jgi:hypothetical protein
LSPSGKIEPKTKKAGSNATLWKQVKALIQTMLLATNIFLTQGNMFYRPHGPIIYLCIIFYIIYLCIIFDIIYLYIIFYIIFLCIIFYIIFLYIIFYPNAVSSFSLILAEEWHQHSCLSHTG